MKIKRGNISIFVGISILVIIAISSSRMLSRIRKNIYQNRVSIIESIAFSFINDVESVIGDTDFDYEKQQNLGWYLCAIQFQTRSDLHIKIIPIIQKYSNHLNSVGIVMFRHDVISENDESIVRIHVSFSSNTAM